jgi:DNA polymerase I-like protein with 3'-5' exonuclease and polymerase domains
VVHIKKIEVGGDHLVFDISVEEDESYLACGVFSHNSSNPNLQFIPTRTDDGKRLRSLFLPDPGQRWYKIDWSQIEFRLMAHDAACMELPGADVVVEKYQDPEADYHQIVADMAELERRPAKTVNFGLAYGEGLAKLCRQLGLSEEEGRALVRRYHRLVPFMLPMARSYTRRADRDGVVTTLFGRKRRFSRWVTKIKGEEIFTGHRVNGASRRVGTHAALNARIQGSAADIMKKAMVEIHESGVGDVLGPMQLTVHDEVDGSYPDTKLGRDALAEMKQIMEKTVKLRVPLVADLSTGKNWGEC